MARQYGQIDPWHCRGIRWLHAEITERGGAPDGSDRVFVRTYDERNADDVRRSIVAAYNMETTSVVVREANGREVERYGAAL